MYWNVGTLANILFFFMSGLFFRPTTPKEFLTNKPRQLLIPFITFYLLSIPFRFMIDIWDFRDIHIFQWNRILDVFAIEGRSDYLSLNVPLWFLLTLFMIQGISQVTFRFPRPIILLTALLPLFFKDELLSWPTLFMFNNALYWYAFFALGYLLGKPFVARLLHDIKFRYAILATGLLIFTSTAIILHNGIFTDWRHTFHHINQISFITGTLAIMSGMNGFKIMRPIQWIGKYTLEVLCIHLFIMIPLNRLYHKLLGLELPIAGFTMTLITLLILVPVIRLLNDRTPHLLGKKRSIAATA